MSNRKIHRVTPTQHGDWKLEQKGAQRAIGIFENKNDAVDKGRDVARGQDLSQRVIHKKDGTIQTEHTYGKDPRKYPG